MLITLLPSEIVRAEGNEDNSLSSEMTSENIIHIRTAEELAIMSTGSQSTERHYVLENDIHLTGAWAGIEDFRGTFDGRGHTIHNLRGNGLFRSTLDATIMNVTIVIEAGYRVQTTGNNQTFAGGLIHRAQNTNVANAHVVGDVTASHGMGLFIHGHHHAGGLIGYFESTNGNTYRVERSSAIGDVASNSGGGSIVVAGGLIGEVLAESGSHVQELGHSELVKAPHLDV